MEIGSGNLSAVVGPYRQAIATATLKFGIPYLVVDVGDPSAVEPFGGRAMPTAAARSYNLVSVVPQPAELHGVIVDVLAAVHWTRLAVVYHDQTEGLNHASSPDAQGRRQEFLSGGLRKPFWATVCKTVRPVLSDRCLSCLSCLSVTLVYCGQTVGRIKTKLGTRLGFGPGHTVLDREPAPSPQRG